jgi:hypothetical protein
MSLGRCWSHVFQGTIVPQQLAPSDLICAEYTDYPQAYNLRRYCKNVIGGEPLLGLAQFLHPCYLKPILHYDPKSLLGIHAFQQCLQANSDPTVVQQWFQTRPIVQQWNPVQPNNGDQA